MERMYIAKDALRDAVGEGTSRCLQASGVFMSAERQSAQGGKTVKRLGKIKTPTMRWLVQTKEEVDDSIRRIGELQRECSRSETEMNDELAAVKKSYEQKAEKPTEELRVRLASGSGLVRESPHHADRSLEDGKVLDGRSDLEKAPAEGVDTRDGGSDTGAADERAGEILAPQGRDRPNGHPAGARCSSVREGHHRIPAVARIFGPALRDEAGGGGMSGEEVLMLARSALIRVDEILLERSVSHGSPSRQIGRAAKLISTAQRRQVSAYETCLIMAMMKLSRELSCETPNPDNLLDLIGYAVLAIGIRKVER